MLSEGRYQPSATSSSSSFNILEDESKQKLGFDLESLEQRYKNIEDILLNLKDDFQDAKTMGMSQAHCHLKEIIKKTITNENMSMVSCFNDKEALESVNAEFCKLSSDEKKKKKSKLEELRKKFVHVYGCLDKLKKDYIGSKGSSPAKRCEQMKSMISIVLNDKELLL